MKTFLSTIIFLLVALPISAISSAKQSPLEDCIRRKIARLLSPPSKTSNFDLSDELCKDETRAIMFFLRLNGKFPPYYVEALCNIFEHDEKKVEVYVTKTWLNHSKRLLNSLTCMRRTTLVIKKKNIYVEDCIRRNIALSPSPPSNISHFKVMRDQLCRDETRVVMYFLEMNGKFPTYYIEALCNIFEHDEKKVKVYVTKTWLNHSKKLLNSLTCMRRTTLVINKNKSYVEDCIQRNIALSPFPSPSPSPSNTSHFDVMRDQLCRDETRVVMYFLEMNGKFPTYYIKALCNVFGDDDKKVKNYVMRKWLDHSEELINSLACASL